MRRLAGRPAAGSASSDELTVVIVAGADYRPFFRHELTHSYVARRWGPRRAGSWMDEGLAARATGQCQGHSVDAVAASLIDFLQRSQGIVALRSPWRGEQASTGVIRSVSRRATWSWNGSASCGMCNRRNWTRCACNAMAAETALAGCKRIQKEQAKRAHHRSLASFSECQTARPTRRQPPSSRGTVAQDGPPSRDVPRIRLSSRASEFSNA